MASAHPRLALVALSLACFISVTSENLPIAVIPQLAPALSVSPAAIGYLVGGYAVVVALTAIPLVALTARWDRRRAAVVTIGAVAVANVALAMAPDYAVAALARLVAALGHGVFWSIVAPMAGRLVGRANAGRATGTVFVGNALAFIVGLPLSSALGDALGWRWAVTVLAVIAAVAAVAIRLSVPAMPVESAAAVGNPLRVVSRNPALTAVLAATTVLVLGHFTAWTYVTLLIKHYAGLHGLGVSLVLLGNGIAGLGGLLVVRARVDDRPRSTGVAVAAGLAGCMLVLLALGPLSSAVSVVALLAWAVPAGSLAVVLQAAVLRTSPREQDLASAAYVVAFQIGIAGGAGLGGAFVEAHALPGLLVTAASCAAVVTVLMLRARRAFPPHRRRDQAESGARAPLSA